MQQHDSNVCEREGYVCMCEYVYAPAWILFSLNFTDSGLGIKLTHILSLVLFLDLVVEVKVQIKG